MNKKEIIEFLAENGPAESKAAANRQLEAFVEAIQTGLKTHGSVRVVGLGNFSVKERKARKGRNPKTGEEIQISASKTVSYKPDKKIKEFVRS